MPGIPDDCVELVMHSEHGRIPRTLHLVIPTVFTPDEALSLIEEYFDRCQKDGVFEAVAWLIEDTHVITSENDVTYTAEYTYDVTIYPEATLTGETDVEVTIDNKVDDPQTFNLSELTEPLAKSLA